MKWGDTFLEGMVFGASCRTSRPSSASSKWKLRTESLTFKMTLEDSDERLKGWIFGKGRGLDVKMGRSGRSLSCLFLSSWLHVFIESLFPNLDSRFGLFMGDSIDSSLCKLISTAVAQVSCRWMQACTVCPSESLVLLFSANADDRRGLRYCHQPFIGKLRYLRNVFSATSIWQKILWVFTEFLRSRWFKHHFLWPRARRRDHGVCF